uniref:Uncharacterized protein n=1 Tax=Anguilla anguilla TaxID=7936 RepID=A0A0E9QSU3_ANGAN
MQNIVWGGSSLPPVNPSVLVILKGSPMRDWHCHHVPPAAVMVTGMYGIGC